MGGSRVLQGIKLFKFQNSLQANEMQKLLQLKDLEGGVSQSFN